MILKGNQLLLFSFVLETLLRVFEEEGVEEDAGGREEVVEGGGRVFVDSTWKKSPSRATKRNWKKVIRSPDPESLLKNMVRGEDDEDVG